jgi:hypothetical protein
MRLVTHMAKVIMNPVYRRLIPFSTNNVLDWGKEKYFQEKDFIMFRKEDMKIDKALDSLLEKFREGLATKEEIRLLKLMFGVR